MWGHQNCCGTEEQCLLFNTHASGLNRHNYIRAAQLLPECCDEGLVIGDAATAEPLKHNHERQRGARCQCVQILWEYRGAESFERARRSVTTRNRRRKQKQLSAHPYVRVKRKDLTPLNAQAREELGYEVSTARVDKNSKGSVLDSQPKSLQESGHFLKEYMVVHCTGACTGARRKHGQSKQAN